jgi:RAD51-like protein 2
MQVPAALGGPEGSVIYIDTEGSFMIDRVVDIAAAAVSRVNTAAAACSPEVQQQVGAELL